MARNEDSGAGSFMAKNFQVVLPENQPRHYRSVIKQVEIDLPDDPVRYTQCRNDPDDDGIWGAAGVNAHNVAMTATETITTNARVQGADPMLTDAGIGEEDFVTLVLPYIRTAREGVKRLGGLLEQYGTYEMNGIGFQDVNEIWWLETIGGHHWIARRVPDDRYVIMPNQQGIDRLDLKDAFGEGRENLCSPDLIEFIGENHLDLTVGRTVPLTEETAFDVRAAFGSHDDGDHVYNTPRGWFMARTLSPKAHRWDGPDAEYGPESDDIPWSLVPEHLITPEDVKYVLSGHYQGTPFDPYARRGEHRGGYRPIGVNRNNILVLTQLRPYVPEGCMALQWIAMASNVFNEMIPFYANVDATPAYLNRATKTVNTDSLYWSSRLIGALADAHYPACATHVERYQKAMQGTAHRLIRQFDAEAAGKDAASLPGFLAECNQALADAARKQTDELLGKVLYEASCGMKNAFARSDA